VARRYRPRRAAWGWALWGPALLAVLFVATPLAAVLLNTPLAGLVRDLLSPEVLRVLGITFWAGAVATALALLGGVPLGYLLARYPFRGHSILDGLLALPIVLPHTAAGVALLMVYGRRGWLGRPLGLLGIRFADQLAGVVVGMLFVGFPFVVTAAREAFELIEPELEQVAQIDGATSWQAFRLITLPLAARSIAAGALMMWGRGVSEFGAVVVLAYHPKTLPVLVYERFAGLGLVAAQPLTLLVMLVSLILFVTLPLVLRRTTDAA
jgi:molybdate/tungstate transport system permease protein